MVALKIPGVAAQREVPPLLPTGRSDGARAGLHLDDRGQEGLELAFDEWLRGKPVPSG